MGLRTFVPGSGPNGYGACRFDSEDTRGQEEADPRDPGGRSDRRGAPSGAPSGCGSASGARRRRQPRMPAARQTIYAYERGGLTPSLKQFLDLVEFYALKAQAGPTAKPVDDLRAQAVAAVARALTIRAYHVTTAWDLVRRLQPPAGRKR